MLSGDNDYRYLDNFLTKWGGFLCYLGVKWAESPEYVIKMIG